MKHLPSLDGLRAASILLVLLAHTAPLGPKVLILNEMAGLMGMSLFFCLSGQLITSTLLEKPDVWPFLVKRIFRIMPALWLYLLVLIVFFGVKPENAVLNALFVSNYLVAGLGDGPTGHLWSLCVEMQFYLAIGVVVWMAGARGLWLIPVSALFITGLRIDQQMYYNINTHLRVDEILSGGCLALVMHRRSSQIRDWISATNTGNLLLVTAFSLWLISCHPYAGPMNYLRPYTAAATVGMVLLAAPLALQNILASKPAAYIARISYALYIYHALMVAGWMNEGSTELRYLVKRPITWTLTWVAAHLSTFYWEAFWQRFARQRILGEPAKPVTAPSAWPDPPSRG